MHRELQRQFLQTRRGRARGRRASTARYAAPAGEPAAAAPGRSAGAGNRRARAALGFARRRNRMRARPRRARLGEGFMLLARLVIAAATAIAVLIGARDRAQRPQRQPRQLDRQRHPRRRQLLRRRVHRADHASTVTRSVKSPSTGASRCVVYLIAGALIADVLRVRRGGAALRTHAPLGRLRDAARRLGSRP